MNREKERGKITTRKERGRGAEMTKMSEWLMTEKVEGFIESQMVALRTQYSPV